MAHCLFYYQKYWRMRYTNVVMEERYDSYAHVVHCTKLVLNSKNGVDDESILLEVPVVMNSGVGTLDRELGVHRLLKNKGMGGGKGCEGGGGGDEESGGHGGGHGS